MAGRAISVHAIEGWPSSAKKAEGRVLEVSGSGRIFPAETGGVRLDSRDDGGGIDRFRIGNGLNGLRERFLQQDGEITFESAVGRGFRVIGWLPTRTHHS
jgi:hypothetical protein